MMQQAAHRRCISPDRAPSSGVQQQQQQQRHALHWDRSL